MEVITLIDEIEKRRQLLLISKAKAQNQLSAELKYAVSTVLARHGYNPSTVKSIDTLNCALDDLVLELYGEEGNLTGVLRVLSQILKEIEHTETANRMI